MQRQRFLPPTVRFLALTAALAGMPIIEPKRSGFAVEFRRPPAEGDRVLFDEREEIAFTGDARLFAEQIASKLETIVGFAFSGERRSIGLRSTIGFAVRSPDGFGLQIEVTDESLFAAGAVPVAPAEHKIEAPSSSAVARGTELHKRIARELERGAGRIEALDRTMKGRSCLSETLDRFDAGLAALRLAAEKKAAKQREEQRAERIRRESKPHPNKLQRRARKMSRR